MEIDNLNNKVLSKNITLTSNNWVQNNNTKYWEYTVQDESVTAQHIVDGRMDLANQAKMTDGYIESYNGSYKIITSSKPGADIDISVSITKTIEE